MTREDPAARPPDPPRDALDRRTVLKGLVMWTVATAGIALAQHGTQPMQHGAPGATAGGPGFARLLPPASRLAARPAAHSIPWADGTCAFCGMTLATPEGFAQGPGFRERTYAQWAFDDEARHFESLACAFNWAYAHGVVDGEGGALHVAPYDLAARPSTADLLAGRRVTFLWAEGLPASMRARLGAFADRAAAAAFVARFAEGALGRRRFVDLNLLTDFAPLPEANLETLLAYQVGLIG
jgi:hypothetical protein